MRNHPRAGKAASPLTFTLYAYVKPQNGMYAKTVGRMQHGSFSAYVDHLIAKDRMSHGPRNNRGSTPRARNASR
jgi:hypothetical protein